ncbi:NADH dehydrogenase, partial [Operophtera brumata]
MLPNIAKQIIAVCPKTRLPLLSFLRHKAAYEGEGKTTVRVINQEHDLGLMIDSYATVIGLESNDRSKFNSVFKAARANKLNIEILPTEHACSTFNFLNAECRSVAGALIPPLKLEMNENDMLHTKIHYQD